MKTMTGFSDHTKIMLERLVARDHDHVGADGRTRLFLHEGVRPVCVVLYHGLSASPKQFLRFAQDLYDRGHNVVVPRLPRHGHRDRLSAALSYLTAGELRSFASESVDLAQGLGDRVVVAGFSLGGLLTTWIAEHYAVDRAVAIAPFFGISWVPGRAMSSLTAFLLRLPNYFQWWDPIAREKQMPAHGYPRYSTHALAQSYLLAQEVFESAGNGIAARELVFVTNAREAAINNRAVRRLETLLRANDPTHLRHVVLRDIPPSHDIIEPLRHPGIADQVYPQLLGIINGPVETV